MKVLKSFIIILQILLFPVIWPIVSVFEYFLRRKLRRETIKHAIQFGEDSAMEFYRENLGRTKILSR